MEMPLVEIELDLVQSIKRRQIVGRTRERGGIRKEKNHLEKKGKGEQIASAREREEKERESEATQRDEAAETSQIKDAVTVNS